jgi:chemotaxis protein CheX
LLKETLAARGDGHTVEFEKHIAEATLEVFASMVFMEITAEKATDVPSSSFGAELTSMIGLAGDLKGVIAIHCPAPVALAITGAMLGMELDSLDEDVKDAIGEIANMVAGGLKDAVSSTGLHIELSIPSTVIGKGVRTGGLASSRFVLPFTTSAGVFAVEMKYVLA